jgi:hypothetical protein
MVEGGAEDMVLLRGEPEAGDRICNPLVGAGAGSQDRPGGSRGTGGEEDLIPPRRGLRERKGEKRIPARKGWRRVPLPEAIEDRKGHYWDPGVFRNPDGLLHKKKRRASALDHRKEFLKEISGREGGKPVPILEGEFTDDHPPE